MAYAPLPGNMTSGVDFFSWVNSTISGWFFPGSIIAVFFIILIKLMFNPQSNISQSFAAASFICMILSILLRVADLVDNAFMVIFIILTAVGAVWMHVENDKFG